MLSRRFFSSIRERLQKDLITALKSKDTQRSGLIRQLQAEIVNFEKSKAGSAAPPSEVSLIGVLQGCSEKWAHALTEYQRMLQENPSRADDIAKAIEKERIELEVIKSYLPEPYTPAEIVALIDRTVRTMDLPTIDGKVLGKIMNTLAASADLTRVTRKELAEAVKNYITKNTQ